MQFNKPKSENIIACMYAALQAMHCNDCAVMIM